MELWKMCRAVNNANRLAMLREIARSPGRGLNVLQAGDFVGLGKAAASQYLKQLSEAGFLMVERSGKFVVCSCGSKKGIAAAGFADVLERVFPEKARKGWQAPLLETINAFAHHLRERIVRAVATAGRTGFEELAKSTDAPPATLRRQLGILVSAGVVKLGGDAKGLREYSISASGDPLLRALVGIASAGA